MDIIVKLLADGLIVAIALIAVIALVVKTPKSDRYDRYTRIVMAGITSYMLAKFVGSIWRPEDLRPFERLGVDPGAAYLNNPGFPSDHALFGAFLTLAVWYGTRNRKLAIILAGMTVLMGTGRVLALVHTPLDIAGGLLIAAIGGVWYVGYGKKKPHTHMAKLAKK